VSKKIASRNRFAVRERDPATAQEIEIIPELVRDRQT